MQSNKLKDDILRLLKEDEEFRYAIIGLLGLQRLENAVAKLVEAYTSLEKAVNRLIDIQIKQEERLTKVEERLTKVEERLEEHDKKFNEIIEELKVHRLKLEEHDKKFNEIVIELRDLRRISNEHTRILQKHDSTLKEIKSYIERTSITLEEEAREVIEYRLREKGIIMNITNLILEDIEIDIYATDTNLCLIGEAKTRVSKNVIIDVDNDIERLCRKYPNYLKDKVIKAVYGMQILPEALDEARKRGIWLVTANKEYTELIL